MASSERRTEGVLEWDDYFMAVAFLSAKRSKDPRTTVICFRKLQIPLKMDFSSSDVGACIVNERKRICGTGYNGMPDGCSDDKMQWDREGKKLFVCHAEMNAILNKNSADVRGCTIYTSLFPCNECAKVIIQAGITEVIYYSDKKKDKATYKAARKMFDLAKVKLREKRPKRKITIDFTEMDDDDKGDQQRKKRHDTTDSSEMENSEEGGNHKDSEKKKPKEVNKETF